MQGQARPGVDFKARQTAQIPRRGPIPLGNTGALAVRMRAIKQRGADIIRPLDDADLLTSAKATRDPRHIGRKGGIVSLAGIGQHAQ